jgi:hypothetical protein
MVGEQGVAERWRRSDALPWIRFFGGLLLSFAGVWVVVAGPLYNRMWLVVVGLAMLLLGGYLTRLGVRGLWHQSTRDVLELR